MLPPKEFRKAIIAAVGSCFAMLTKSLGDGHITGAEIAQITGATVVSGLTVYLIPNGEKAKKIG